MKPENRVRERRVGLLLSQQALCERSGLGIRTIRRVEARTHYPNLLSRQRLAVALLTSPEDLFPRG